MSGAAPTVAVLGLGLVGGSLARDLARLGHTVIAWDHDDATLRAARHASVIHIALDASLAGLEEAEHVVLAVPVDVAPELLERAVPRLAHARLITDVGSTKRGILEAAVRLGVGRQFVGSHPLAGDHRSGWVASREGLFREARVFICPAADTSAEAVQAARSLWARVGGRTELLDAAAHDLRLAWASHLPQLAASALALALRGAGVAAAELGPGGRDATRLAGSSAAMWTPIALANADAIAPALAALETRLHELRTLIEAGSAEALRSRLVAAADWTRDA